MSLAVQYIVLAVGCGLVGIIVTFATLLVCQYLAVDITRNVWILAIPVLSSLLLNVSLIELYRRFRKR